jgi:hypothetical protein
MLPPGCDDDALIPQVQAARTGARQAALRAA